MFSYTSNVVQLADRIEQRAQMTVGKSERIDPRIPAETEGSLCVGISIHDVFDTVTSREITAEQRCEDVAVAESEESAAGPEASVDDIPYAGFVECLENWK